MAQTPSSERKATVTRTRPSVSTNQPSDSLRTPVTRSISGLYGSPGSSFRIEDENQIIFEFGSRYMRAGFAGEPGPRCTTQFSPHLWRRAGDYRQWEMGYEKQTRRKVDWGEEYELWRPDVHGLYSETPLDQGLVEDRIGKCVRDCENNYLLLDNRTKKVALVVPSSLPRPLLSVVLGRLFEGLQAPTVSLLPSAVMATAAAGARSALVIDIGWHETTATAVYEYREVLQQSTIRAGKKLSQEFAKLLEGENQRQNEDAEHLPFEEVEEVMTRVGWCQDAQNPTKVSAHITPIPLPSSPNPLEVPFMSLARPAEEALFASWTPPEKLDDEDQPVHYLIYNSLLALPIDIRQICMSRIVLTGGVSNLPGLKRRVLSEVSYLVESRGFDPVRNYGSATARTKRKVDGPTPLNPTLKREDPVAGLAPQELDQIAHTLSQQTSKEVGPPPVGGQVRGIHTLGAWAGASLIVNQKVKGIVEIERERFLQHGLVGGASAGKKEQSVVPEPRSRQSLGPNVKAGVDRGSWTLGVWG
ncbi:actin-like ATPase domain-containing protein [Venturia nashicola]|uniref:Actin-like ATPase domain-containing protein n=1 Tax=Venturia nashicola TaxID=86259 RepID=A0A4Z1NXX7_9PEZI|nr:actin-like ATPase domain-containing protein [Venturia nashicola]